MSDDDTTKRCHAYLTTIFNGAEKPDLGDDIASEGGWGEWLTRHGIFFPHAAQHTGKWFGDVVQRALLRIDDIARRASQGVNVRSNGIDWAEQCCKEVIAVINVPWGSDRLQGALMKLRHKVGEHCERYHGGILGSPFLGANYEIFGGGYSLTPTLAVFPCYLTASRRKSWDVLEYGRQKRLVLVGREACLKELQLRDEEMSQLSETVTKLPKALDPARFRGAVQSRLQEGGWKWYYFGIGHAAFQIALEVVLGGKMAVSNHRRLRYVLCNIDSDDQVADAKAGVGAKTRISALAEVLGRDRTNEYQVLLSDMGVTELETLRSEMGNSDSMRWVRFDHDLDLPVGLGFSLCTVPIFLRHPTLLQALAKEVAEFASVEVQADFWEHGIQVVPQVRETRAMAVEPDRNRATEDRGGVGVQHEEADASRTVTVSVKNVKNVSVVVGDRNTTASGPGSTAVKNDFETWAAKLREAGIPDGWITELKDALDDGAKDAKGGCVSDWLDRLRERVAEGSLKLVSGVTVNQIGDWIRSFLGNGN